MRISDVSGIGRGLVVQSGDWSAGRTGVGRDERDLSVGASGIQRVLIGDRYALQSERVIFKLHSHQTADQPRRMPTNFYGLVGYDRVNNYPLWLKSVSIPDQHPLYPHSIPDAPTLKSPSSRPSPVLPADQSPLCTTNPRPIPDTTTLTTLNIGTTPDLISTPGFQWIIQANVMPTDSLMKVQYPKCAYGPYC